MSVNISTDSSSHNGSYAQPLDENHPSEDQLSGYDSGSPSVLDRLISGLSWLTGQRFFAPLIVFLLAGGALFLVWEQLHHLSWPQIQADVANVSDGQMALAIVLTFVALAAMGLYDAFAFSAGEAGVSFVKRWMVGCFAFAWSNLMSVGGIAGPAVRVLLYRKAGLKNREIVQGLGAHYLAASFGLIAWLIVLLMPWPDAWSAPVQLAGQGLLALAICVLLGWLSSHQLLPIFTRLLARKFPEVSISAGALRHKFIPLSIVSFADWGFTCLVFVVLVNAAAPHAELFSVPRDFFLGLTTGLLSGLPGGVGTADAVWLHLLGPKVGGSPIAAAILMFRLVFYLLPWLVALVAFYIYLSKSHEAINDWHRRIVAVTIGMGGLWLLLSAALPAVPDRITWMAHFTPVGVIETSHLLAVGLACALLYLTRGLLKGYRSAFLMTVAILGVSIFANLTKGLDVEEGVLSTVMLAITLVSAKEFTRRGRFTLSWELVLAVSVGSLFLYLFVGFAAFENIPYRPDLWITFTPSAEASRFLRGIPVLVLIALIALVRLAMKGKTEKIYANESDIIRAEGLIQQHGQFAEALLVAGGDKAVWFWTPENKGQEGKDRGLIQYQRVGDTLVVFKDPVIDDMQDGVHLIRDFMAYADDLDADVTFSLVSSEWIDALHDFGFRFIKFSQEAVLDLTDFNLKGKTRQGLRTTLNRCEKQGITFEVLQPPFSAEMVEACRQVSDAWLDTKGGKEMQFSACYFSEAYLQRYPIGVATDENHEVVAFVNLLATREGGEVTFDFMRYKPGVINNLMDFVIVKAALYLQEQGYSRFSLGGAALSNVGKEKTSLVLERLLRSYSHYSESIYNYNGLYHYKNKFSPEWVPRYIAYRFMLDWGQALYFNIKAVKPSPKERQRIERARMAKTYDQF